MFRARAALDSTNLPDPHLAHSWSPESATLQAKPEDQLRGQEPPYLASPRDTPCCQQDLTTSNCHGGSAFRALKSTAPPAYSRLRRGWDHSEGGKILSCPPRALPEVGILRPAVKPNPQHKAEDTDRERTCCRHRITNTPVPHAQPREDQKGLCLCSERSEDQPCSGAQREEKTPAQANHTRRKSTQLQDLPPPTSH